ncbi:hypothetical protein GRI94_17225 [Erythrobacter jejuensis]|uniref:PilZ domain-containing protein n=1 Tax=Parerythrobacter jejuensis TaxID=795812 RepID=A0A845AVH2_9SPHN|nr:hypothetical protein [Parerythrobacter jejuensis]MXP33574.1 hypothetical protein [Parerythrobacter jejuensis]
MQTSSITPLARRERSRLKTRLPARITTLTHSCTAVLLDISITGARIELSPYASTPVAFQIGETVLLQWGNFEKLGHLVWEVGTVAGMVFEELVTPREIIATRDMQDELARNGGLQSVEHAVARSWYEGHAR